MSYVRTWIHAVWSTKNRSKTLIKHKRNDVFKHIKENGKKKDLFIYNVNGHIDHVHCLFRLRADLSIKDTMQLIKGESSFYVNKHKLLPSRLKWQSEYYAVGVSESKVSEVAAYLDKQEEHHKHKTWEEELEEYLVNHNFKTYRT